ncbi:tetratricopeptide repeat protein [Bartonella tribocorum]|uniref:Tol-pal system protein n=1 Tax=Bartonella tribocorum TaxID=85701 RepID=A0A2M6UWI2_9HYPH|nr:tetratricopeptide repeat protein [Bartonella tribocorum]PIT70517.1 tol-pal system protein [Bartonella tribocorum]
MRRKMNWKTLFYMAVFIACSTSFAESMARKTSEYPAHDTDKVDAADKAASDVVEKAPDAADKAASDVVEKATDAADKAASDVVEKATDAADKAASDVVEKATDAADKAASGAEKSATDAADKAASDAVEKAPDAADKAASDAVVVEKATDAADKAAPDVVEKATDAADKAASGAEKSATDAADKAASDAVEKAPDAADKAASDVMEKATDAADKAASDVVEKATDAADKAASDAVEKVTEAVDKAASDAVEKATDVADKAASEKIEKASDTAEHKGIILENQQVLFKDYDLDKLLHKIRMVLEHNNLKNVQKQFHRLFDKKDSSVYSCSFENAALDEKSQSVKEEMVQELNAGDQTKIADVKDHDTEQTGDHLKKAHEVSARSEAHQSNPLSSAKALYKEGYDFIRSANYVDAEKSFCAFQNRYKKDPLNDDALFWLAESLLGQKRYHEAAQVYLTAWYADKKKLYTSEILLKLARSMIALEKNEKDCALFAKNSKHHQMLESVFCKPTK